MWMDSAGRDVPLPQLLVHLHIRFCRILAAADGQKCLLCAPEEAIARIASLQLLADED
jgi:hypothetical protein